jgi:hypothetical protein
MTHQNTDSDSWGQLLSDFGIEDKKQRETAGQPEGSPAPTASNEEVGDDSAKPKEKKSMFSRFPKINFFGAPPEVSLDSVIEGTKSPTLGGKAFTDNKLEKMPLSHERTDRREKHSADIPDTLSVVASQIDTLASGRDTRAKSAERPSRRHVDSMFDDPVPESDEARALKNIMGKQSSPTETHRSAFLEEESDSRSRGRGRRQHQPEEKREDRGGRGHHSRYKPPVEVDDLPETDFEPVDELPRDHEPQEHGRGRRGSRYAGGGHGGHRDRGREPIHDDGTQEEWSEVDAALQQADRGRRGEPRHRGGRQQQRYDNRQRPERPEKPIDRQPLEEDGDVVMTHGSVPSWDEAVGDIVASNIARRKGSQSGGGHSGRGRR